MRKPFLKTLTQEQLKAIVSYDPETGFFYRFSSKKFVTTIGFKGYVSIGIDKVSYPVHRLVWLYVHGEWPNGEIDHINGVRHDNRLVNLRVATASQNRQNQTKPRSDNTSGFLGVGLNNRGAKFKYRAQIKSKGKLRILGVGNDPAALHLLYVNAKRSTHEFGTL